MRHIHSLPWHLTAYCCHMKIGTLGPYFHNILGSPFLQDIGDPMQCYICRQLIASRLRLVIRKQLACGILLIALHFERAVNVCVWVPRKAMQDKKQATNAVFLCLHTIPMHMLYLGSHSHVTCTHV